MNTHSKSRTRRKALGIAMSGAPPLEQLHDEVQRMMSAGASHEEIDVFMCEKARNDPEMGLRAMLGINRKVARFSAAKLVYELGKHYAGLLRKKNVQQAMGDYAHKHELDRWLADYMWDWIEQGEPPAYSERHVKWVGELNIGPKDDKTKLVGVIVNALATPHEVAEEFIAVCERAFPPETMQHKPHAVRDAERLRAFATGMTDFDIAKAELEAEGSTEFLKSTGEYYQEVATRSNSVCVARRRYDEHLTKMLDPVSPVSE